MKNEYETPKIVKIIMTSDDVIKTSFVGVGTGTFETDVPEYTTPPGKW